jgi:predicted acylesterase/phospholipase RssA
MESNASKPKFGLALSGSGNRSAFYIGFLEYLDEINLKPDYITACSGGSMVAAAYACGSLAEFKKLALGLTPDSLKNYMVRSKGGGIFNVDLFEEALREYTKGLNFEEVRPLMGFVAVDIESGEKVLLCMGDIAKAARISCTLPGIFEPVKWGDKTLVDGGLLTMVPSDFLKQAGMDVTVGINMRGTKHIFTETQINAKKVLNFFKKILLINGLGSLLNNVFKEDPADNSKIPGIFEVIGKSMDLAIAANKNSENSEADCDLTIISPLPKSGKDEFNPEISLFYYQKGRETAAEYAPKILELIKAKI